MQFKIVYDKPGRLRVRMGRDAFNSEQGYGLEALIMSVPSVSSVAASPANGGLLICYRHDCPKQVFDLLEGLDERNLPVSKALDANYKREIDDKFFRTLAYILCRHFAKKIFLPPSVRLLVTIYDAIRYWRKGISSLIGGKINVDVLDASSIFASIAQGNFTAASSIMTLLRVSEALEGYTRKKARQSLAESLALNIDCVWLVCRNDTILTPISQIRVGDRIHVHAGSAIPLDGDVLSGEALVNEASMTGEPHGVMRSAGSVVFAGTIVEEGSIEVRVRTLADNTRVQNILSLIDNSEMLKASVQSKAEKLADTIVPFSFIAAAATLLLTRSAARATSVLTVDYSCAIKLTTPICIISAMHEAAKHRILVKGGKHLEAFAHADTIVFDKTGTLTLACPKVAKVIPFGGLSRKEALKISACLEEHFPHSVAKAIVNQAKTEKLGHREKHAEPEYIVAHGISSMLYGKRVLIGSWHFLTVDEGIEITDEEKAVIESESEGFSTVFLAMGGKLAGMICIEDPVRPEVRDVLQQLRKFGIQHIIMLTGDSEAAAKSACAEIGITEYYAGVLPEGKADIIRNLREQGRTVIMVGDGINDSPALAQANVSVAMKDGSDIAKEVADISLLSENLNGLITLRQMSRELLRHVNRNYRHIVGFNTALLLLGAAGLIQPSTSAVLHNASTMLLSGLSMKSKSPQPQFNV
ncbi:MAG: heavy metal translocating P-type ATPase [Oscillospiraceae bacterium]|nr:heavy metal translocating P-type ATPase [Oscillospiraceae bacterium]